MYETSGFYTISINSIGREVIYESRYLNGNIKDLSVSPKLTGVHSHSLITITEFYPHKNHANTMKKFSIVSLEFKKKSEINVRGT
jgi:hypothetical protein